jgi:tetratricopeptide (TPR) repeat protein
VAISPPGLDKVPPGPARVFVDALHSLYDGAGRPGARVVSTRIRRNRDLAEPVSHETVGSALRGASVPSWAKVRSIVVTLALMAEKEPDQSELLSRFHSLWLAAQSAQARPAVGTATQTVQTIPQPLDRVRQEMQPLVTAVRASRPAAPIIPVIGLPERNPFFVGRELLLDRMRDRLDTSPNAPLVLFGLSGVGKSQLAREYVERFSRSYAVIWWVPAERPERARGSLVRLAERLGITKQHSAGQTIATLLGQLESRAFAYVLVLDGVGSAGDPETDEIRRMIPAIGGHVIMTTRDPAWAYESATTFLEVTDFSRAEAIQFLRKRDDELTRVEADELVDALGLLPLALDQVTALQVATSQSWTELIARLFAPDATLLAAGQPSHYPHTVAVSLRLALDQLATLNPLAVPLFEFFAWFGSGPVSVTLLLSGARGIGGRSARILRDPYQLRRAIADMNRMGLVRLNRRTQNVEVQPLTRRVLRDLMTPDALERAQQGVHDILSAADPGWPDDLASWESHRDMATHILPAGLIESRSEPARRTVLNQIRYRYLIGDYEDARQLAKAAVSAWREDPVLGADHELVLLALHEGANASRAIGRYEEARLSTVEAMRGLQARVGDDHPYTLAVATSIAADLNSAGAYADGLHIAEETHRRHAALWGDADPRTAACRHNVGMCLRLLGTFEQARVIDDHELDLHRTAEGDRHLRTLLSASALAEDLYGLGRYTEVLHLLLPLLNAWREVAPTHAAALLADRTVALAHAGLGRFSLAVERLRQHHYECTKAFGVDHEHTLAATMSYALVLCRGSDVAEAHVHATYAESAYRRTFGARNPLTLAAEVNLAVILRALGERRSARQADSVAWEVLRATVGDRHPFTITAAVGLACDLWHAEDHAGALVMSQRAYDDSVAVLGRAHPNSLMAAANLALDRRAAGDVSGADTLVAEVLASLRRTLGPEHPIVTAVASGQRVDVGIEPPANLLMLASSGHHEPASGEH